MARKEVSITLKLNQLVYEIENKTYLTGLGRADGTNYETVSNMQADVSDEGNRVQVIRSISNAVATIKSQLERYIATDSSNAVSNQLTSNISDDIVIKLDMPKNYATSQNDAVAQAMHLYVVNKCVAEWFLITNKEDAEEYFASATANLEAMKISLNKRVRPVRIEND